MPVEEPSTASIGHVWRRPWRLRAVGEPSTASLAGNRNPIIGGCPDKVRGASLLRRDFCQGPGHVGPVGVDVIVAIAVNLCATIYKHANSVAETTDFARKAVLEKTSRPAVMLFDNTLFAITTDPALVDTPTPLLFAVIRLSVTVLLLAPVQLADLKKSQMQRRPMLSCPTPKAWCWSTERICWCCQNGE